MESTCSPLPRLKRAWGVLAASWAATHVERHGKYSVERLRQLHKYEDSKSLARSWLIIALTPLPCLAAITLLDAIPLQPPSLGLGHSHTFWLRTFLMAWMTDIAVMVQLRHIVSRLGVTITQVVAVGTVVAISAAANGVILANLIGFPVPFTIALGSIGTGSVFVICLVVLWGRTLQSNPEIRAELVNYITLVSKQVALIYIYPVFSYVFNRLDSYQQAAFALLLPLLKIALKNWVNSSIKQFEDLKPEIIVFNVEIFHALYVAYSMQSATSQSTIAVLMAMDFFQACSSYRWITMTSRLRSFFSLFTS
ncbi:hypothetical protein Gpo141_00014330 [Globisporangium polare]